MDISHAMLTDDIFSIYCRSISWWNVSYFLMVFYTVRCRLGTHLAWDINCDLRCGVVDTEVRSVGRVNYCKPAPLHLHSIQEIYKKKIYMPLYFTFAVAQCFPTEMFERFVVLSLELLRKTVKYCIRRLTWRVRTVKLKRCVDTVFLPIVINITGEYG